MCFYIPDGFIFSKLEKLLPCHTLHLTFHFLMTTFNNLYHPEFPLSPYIYLLISRHFRFLFSSEIAFMVRMDFSVQLISVSTYLVALTSPILLSITLYYVASFSNPASRPVTCTFIALLIQCPLLYSLHLQVWSFQRDKIMISWKSSLDSRSFLSTYVSGQLIKIWTYYHIH